jgi:hypothetical protein
MLPRHLDKSGSSGMPARRLSKAGDESRAKGGLMVSWDQTDPGLSCLGRPTICSPALQSCCNELY